jgi:hypothetical protein
MRSRMSANDDELLARLWRPNSLPVAKISLSATEQTIEEAEPHGDRHSLERVLPDIIFRGVHGLDRAILRAPGLPLGDISNCRGEFLHIALYRLNFNG